MRSSTGGMRATVRSRRWTSSVPIVRWMVMWCGSLNAVLIQMVFLLARIALKFSDGICQKMFALENISDLDFRVRKFFYEMLSDSWTC